MQDPKGTLGLLAGLMGLALVARGVCAAAKPFWFDELFTVLLAQLPSLAKVREVLDTGADAMPLFYYWLEKQAGRLPVDPHVAFRLPSVAGYLLAVAGVYFFARRWLSPVAGMVGALVLALSPFREYAIEARPYALMVGSIAVAAALWQRAEEHWAYPALFGGSLSLGVACHHYTVAALSCFGVAEITVLWLRRRWRWRVWIPLVVSTAPFWIGLPLLLRFREAAGPNFWAKPDWTVIPSSYLQSGVSLAFFAALVALAGLGYFRVAGTARSVGTEDEAARGQWMPGAVLAASLLLYPVALYLAVRTVEGGFSVRYNWPYIIGFALVCAFTAQALMDRRTAVGIAGVLAACLLLREVVEVGANWRSSAAAKVDESLRGLRAALEEIEPGLPVVTAGTGEWLPLFYYGEPRLRERLVMLADAEASRRYGGHDTTARAVLGLGLIAPDHFQSVGWFLAQQKRFYVWSSPDQSRWVVHYLKRLGYRVQVAAATGKEDLIFLAESIGGQGGPEAQALRKPTGALGETR